MNLGNALLTLGERESGTARLKEAVAACHAALEEVTREAAPLWYDIAQQNLALCLALLEQLSPNHEGKLRDLKKIDYSNPAACPACPLRSRCTTDRRRVSRLENEAVLDRMDARLKARPEILDRRREIVEHPFGSIKQWMNQGAFLI
jgi:ATP-dependent helicase YprA (DUF1998 family)